MEYGPAEAVMNRPQHPYTQNSLKPTVWPVPVPKTQSFLDSGNSFMSLLAINHIHYRRPLRPCVAVCIDGSDPSYLGALPSAGAPKHRAFHPEGFAGTAQSSVPAFTCPNNMSIITGVPVSQHGISGNYYL